MIGIILTILGVQCEWSAWSVSNCSEPCDGGVRLKTRKKLVEEIASTCNGEIVMQESCNEFDCPGILQITLLPRTFDVPI